MQVQVVSVSRDISFCRVFWVSIIHVEIISQKPFIGVKMIGLTVREPLVLLTDCFMGLAQYVQVHSQSSSASAILHCLLFHPLAALSICV